MVFRISGGKERNLDVGGGGKTELCNTSASITQMNRGNKQCYVPHVSKKSPSSLESPATCSNSRDRLWEEAGMRVVSILQ
jgi:hypothetical protein